MTYSTSNTYQLKRKIVTFSNKISAGLSKSERKFSADMTYGMLASKSCLLTDIVDQLHEPSKKVNGVDRLSKHLAKGLPDAASQNYFSMIKDWIPSEPIVHLDDSDVIKPVGHKFEALGTVRDGSKSSATKNVY
ncbi:MAG: hypothetical protein RR335_08415 [Eubacterium sp.]